MPNHKLGIIGTAGRGDDRYKLDGDVFDLMIRASMHLARKLNASHGVSGGAAYADHCLVKIGLSWIIPPEHITLYLPAEIDVKQKTYVDDGFRSAGAIANYYMRLFYEATGCKGVAEILELQSLGATLDVDRNGFKSRNTSVAKFLQPPETSTLLAWTFGSKNIGKITEYPMDTSAADAGLKDGGTADTWNKAHCHKFHACL